MKKYLLGIFAIILAVGFSAFTTAKKTPISKKQTTAYWFSVDKHAKFPADPISDADASFLGSTADVSILPDNDPNCSESTYDCLVYFTNTSKLSSSLNSISGSQNPDMVVSERDQ